MKCKKCGTEFESPFCPNCGEKSETYTDTPAQKPIKKNSFKIPALCVIATILLFVLFWSFQTGTPRPKTSSAEKETRTTQNNNAEDDIDTDKTDQENAGNIKKNVFELKDTAVFDEFKITANQLKESYGSPGWEPESGNIFVGIEFTVENISEDNDISMASCAFEGYADNFKTNTPFSIVPSEFDTSIFQTVAPNKKLTGWCVVEAPENWRKLEISFRPNLMSSWNYDRAAFEFEK